MEVLRRGMWNFIRVEYQHIELCKVFKVTIDVELPFKKNENGEYVLRSINTQMPKISKRIEKLKTGGINSVYQSYANLVDLENNNRLRKQKSTKEYESTDFRKKFTGYIKEFQHTSAQLFPEYNY
jgi:putative salt-induced outer membrane protein YdiY